MNRSFYNELPVFREFERFTESAYYRSLPPEWVVYVTDVVNSTQAIAAGKYKEVNLIGAASITLCINLLGELRFPFVFGGDGASLCIPSALCAQVDAELGSLIRLAADNFGLQLRVARIPIAEIEAAGSKVEVARFELEAGNTLAFFRGGGMELADHLAKTRYQDYAVPASAVAVEELAGLSCRWSPIPARKGCVLSILVKARQGRPQDLYVALLQELREVMGESLETANPGVLSHARYTSFWTALRQERSYHRSLFSAGFLKRCIEIVLAIIIFRHGINVAKNSFDSVHYVRNVSLHSDYRKYDDMLRLVLDCSEDQADGIESVLERTRVAGDIFYGIYRSDEALMTCFVQTMQDGGHLHFIDGGSGGLAMAAQQLKAQVAGAQR
jgi:hypothetical protein